MGAGHPLEDDGMDDDQGRESPGDDALPDDGLDGETLGEDGLDEDALGETTRPLPADERESVEADLQDLKGMRVVFESQGAKGVVINCTDCGMNHYFGWELLKESLEHMLQTGEPRMHEPAFAPNEEDYIAWDYAKGYLDALGDAGLGPESRFDVRACPWCSTKLEPDYSFCPRCGRTLAVARLYVELVERGLDERDVRVMLTRAGFEPPA
jgi:Family of unknown function (DUF5319)/zinc-ribbon domain